MQFEPSVAEERQASRFLPGLAYCVVHASALYAFLTWAMATSGLEFFYFYPREAQTLLQPFALDAMAWLGAAIFSVLGLIMIGLQKVRTREVGTRLVRVVLIVGLVALLVALVLIPSASLTPFWLIGTVAVGLCWLGFGFGIARILGGRGELLKVFFASLLGIGAILETWSLGHWVYFGAAPSAAIENVGADLEMNLTYAASSLFPVILVATWLSPLWTYVAFKLYQTAKRSSPVNPSGSDSSETQRMRFQIDDLASVLAITLICVLVGFYAYFRDPSWLVGTDAYWRYNDPLEHITGSSNVLAAAADERHGLYLLILYAVHSATGLSPFSIVKASPVVLATLLSLLTYLGVVYYRRNRREGFFAGFFSATTFPTTLGIFAAVDANWFAMIVALVAVFVLVSLGASNRNAVPKVFLAVFCGIVLLVLHPWTWGILALATFFAALIFLAKRNWRMFGASLIVPVSGLISAAAVYVSGTETERVRLLETLSNFSAPLANESLVLSPFGVIGDSLRIWAPFLNPVFMILVIFGALFLVSERLSSYKIYVLSWMLVTGIGTFFAVTLQTELWRIWYVQPLWLVAGAGVSGVLRLADSRHGEGRVNSEVAMVGAIVIMSGAALLLLQPILGSWIFYMFAVLPVLFNFRRGPPNSHTVLATCLVLFVTLFFMNHALRSLYPLILDPHNFRPH